jgi:integration host factor subunit alpha
MTLTKADLINQVFTSIPSYTKAQARESVETLLAIMKSCLINGEDLLLSGFGKFSVREKAARRGRNPQTGEDLILDARRVVTFNTSGLLKDKINGE